jgi:hypothetical protein
LDFGLSEKEDDRGCDRPLFVTIAVSEKHDGFETEIVG